MPREVPSVFLSLPGPILYIVLAVLGWVLWFGMTDGCDQYYSGTVGLLYLIFHIQAPPRPALCGLHVPFPCKSCY